MQNLYDHLCDWKTMLITNATRRACHLLEKLQKSKYCGEVPATKLAALQKVAFPCSHRPFILPPEITLITFKALFFFYLVHHHNLHPIIVSILFNFIWLIFTICNMFYITSLFIILIIITIIVFLIRCFSPSFSTL